MSLRQIMRFKKRRPLERATSAHYGHYFFSETTSRELQPALSKLPDPSGAKEFLTQREVVNAIEECEQGTLLLKVKSHRKLLPRFVQLFNQHAVLRIQTKKGLRTTKGSSSYNISSIHDIRIGRKSNLFLQCRADSSEFDALYPDSRCFSVVFHSGNSLDFVAPSELSARQWEIALSFVVADYHTRDRHDALERWLIRNFRLSDANRDGFIDFDECRRLLDLVNLTLPMQVARSFFDECLPVTTNACGDGEVPRLNQAGFMRFYKRIFEQSELEEIFVQFATVIADEKCMPFEKLTEFMQTCQKRPDFTTEQCLKLIAQHEPSETRRHQRLLSYDGFKSLLFGADQMLIKPETSDVYHDMSSFPLNDYFIASSHNTYLMGNQLTSLSSTDGYAQTLKLGCRCVELDIFDGPGESAGEPVIYHKYTITNALRLSNVLQIIKEYAFVTSEYPLILSFESHVVDLQQQRTMARMIREIFGDMLLTPVDYQEQRQLPSPSEIKRKIIVKHKRLPLAAKGDDDVVSNDEYDANEIDVNDADMRQLVAGSVKVHTETTTKAVIDAKRRYNKKRAKQLRRQLSPPTEASSAKAIKLARELSDLVVYCVPRKFTSPLSDCAKLAQWYEIMAIAEPHGLELLKTDPFTFAELAKKVMFRMYPGNLRLNSSNYDPCPFWQYGAQIVALNYQCLDEGLLVSIGKFLDNGNCGYVLKPDYLRSSASPEYTRERLDPTRRTPTIVNIQVISGQQLPRAYATHTLTGVCVEDDDDIPDPYVSIHVFGHELDRREWQSKVITDNGFSPRWDEQLTLSILFPELAVILFQVKDYDEASFDDLIGWKALPLDCMQQGYRHIELISPTLEPMPLSTLFVKVGIETECIGKIVSDGESHDDQLLNGDNGDKLHMKNFCSE